MKRVWIAVGLLLALFTAALAHSFYINAFTRRLTGMLEQAEIRAEKEDWSGAEALNRQAHQAWDDHSMYLHVTLRHNNTNEIYTDFHETAKLIQREELGNYSAANARLISELRLLSDSERLNLKNIL